MVHTDIFPPVTDLINSAWIHETNSWHKQQSQGYIKTDQLQENKGGNL